MDKIEQVLEKYIDFTVYKNPPIKKELAQAIRDIDPWIPVEVSLPEDDLRYEPELVSAIVLVSLRSEYGTCHLRLARWLPDKEKWLFMFKVNIPDLWDVTHWLKITPPQEG